MKEELQQIANKHDMELREVIEVAKELLDKIEEDKFLDYEDDKKSDNTPEDMLEDDFYIPF